MEPGSVFKMCASGAGSGKVHKKVKESTEEKYMRYKSQFKEEDPGPSEQEDVQEETVEIKESAPVVKKKTMVAPSTNIATSDQHDGNPRLSKKERYDIKKNKKRMAKALQASQIM